MYKNISSESLHHTVKLISISRPVSMFCLSVLLQSLKTESIVYVEKKSVLVLIIRLVYILGLTHFFLIAAVTSDTSLACIEDLKCLC